MVLPKVTLTLLYAPFLGLVVVLQLRTDVQVTVCLAIFRGFPWRKVPGYVLGQLIGAWAGAIIVFGNYFHAIDIAEGEKGKRTLKTASLFSTYAVSGTYTSAPPRKTSHTLCSSITCLRPIASLTK